MATVLQLNPIDFTLTVTHPKDGLFAQFEYRIFEDGADEEEAEIIPAQGLSAGGDVYTILVGRSFIGNIGATWKAEIRVRNTDNQVSDWTTDTVIAAPNTTSVPEAEGGSPLSDYLLADGTRELTADWDAGSHEIRAQTFQSDVTTGTAPFIVASTTLVANLNADLLDGVEEAAFSLADGTRNFTGVVGGVDPTASNHLATKEYVDMAVSFVQELFFNDTASDIGGIYFVMKESSTGEGQSDFATGPLAAGDGQALTNWATLAGVPGVTTLKGGTYAAHIHAEKSAGTKPVTIYFEIYTRTSGGAETLRATSESTEALTGAETAYEIHATITDDVNILTTDRIVIKWLADVGVAGSNATVTLSAEGLTNASLSIPTSTEVLSSVFLRQDGSTPLTANWNAGAFDITSGATIQAEHLYSTDDLIVDGQVGIAGAVAAGVSLKVYKDNTSGNAIEVANSGSSRSLHIVHDADDTGAVDDIVRIILFDTEVFVVNPSGIIDVGTWQGSVISDGYLDHSWSAPMSITSTDAILLTLVEGDSGVGVIKFQNSDDGNGWYAGITGSEQFGISRTLDLDSGGEFIIAQDGKIGMGTFQPDWNLHVEGASHTAIQSETTGTGDVIAGFIIATPLGDWGIFSGAAGHDIAGDFGIYDYDATAYRLLIDSAGFVGIGTITPGFGDTGDEAIVNASALLEIAGTAGNNFAATLVLRQKATTISAAQDKYIGRILFAGNDISDTGDGVGAKIETIASSFWGSSANDSPTDMSFWTNPNGIGVLAERMRITSEGLIGMGTDAPEGLVHIFSGSAGTVTPHADADDLVIEGTATAGINILSTDAAQSRIFFGSESDNLGAFVRWSYDDDIMRISTHKTGGLLQFGTDANVTALSIDDSQDATFAGDITLPAAGIIDTASGNLELSPAGDLILDPVGNDVLPETGYDLNLGSLQKKYLTLHAAELWVETLVAADTIATIGGRVLIGPTTVLTEDLGNGGGDTTITVKHNQMANGDRVYMEADGKVEFMSIDSAPGGGGPYTYTVTRNLDGSGLNLWYAGDAMFNTGQTGDGFIDLYSVQGVDVAATTGPTIVGNVRNSATYNDWTEHWAIGNLDGLYGYAAETPGIGLGEFSTTTAYITIDSTDGFRIFADDYLVAQWKVDGTVNFYDDGDQERILIGTLGDIIAGDFGIRVFDNSAGDASSVVIKRVAASQGGGAGFYWYDDGTDPGGSDDFDVVPLRVDGNALITAQDVTGLDINLDAVAVSGIIRGIRVDAGDYAEDARAAVDRYGGDFRAEGNTAGEIYGVYGSARNNHADGEMYGGYFTINLAPSDATTGAGLYAAGNAGLSLPAIEAFGDVLIGSGNILASAGTEQIGASGTPFDLIYVDEVDLGTNTITDGNLTGSWTGITNLTAGGTVQAEHIYSTDDIVADGTVQAEHLYSTDDLIVDGQVGIGGAVVGATVVTIHKDNTSGNALEIQNSGESRSLHIIHDADDTGSVDDIVRILLVDAEVFTIGNTGIIDTGTWQGSVIADGYLDHSWSAPMSITSTSAVLLTLVESDSGVGVMKFINSDDGDGWHTGITGAEKFGISRTLDMDSGAEFIIQQDGNIGMGTATPTDTLSVKRSIASSGGSDGIARLELFSTDGFADDNGPKLWFSGGDAAADNNNIGAIAFVRDGADTEGKFILTAGTNGAEEFMTVDAVGQTQFTSHGTRNMVIDGHGVTGAEKMLVLRWEDTTDVFDMRWDNTGIAVPQKLEMYFLASLWLTLDADTNNHVKLGTGIDFIPNVDSSSTLGDATHLFSHTYSDEWTTETGNPNWTGDLIPKTDDTYTLGDATHGWSAIFSEGNINAAGSIIAGADVHAGRDVTADGLCCDIYPDIEMIRNAVYITARNRNEPEIVKFSGGVPDIMPELEEIGVLCHTATCQEDGRPRLRMGQFQYLLAGGILQLDERVIEAEKELKDAKAENSKLRKTLKSYDERLTALERSA